MDLAASRETLSYPIDWRCLVHLYRAAAAPASSNEFGDIDLGDAPDDGSDPIARKLELAEEFRQIGDMEGARDLLQEVIAKASGATKTRAQAMLSDLG